MSPLQSRTAVSPTSLCILASARHPAARLERLSRSLLACPGHGLDHVASVVSQRSSDATVAQPSAAVSVKPASPMLPAAPAYSTHTGARACIAPTFQTAPLRANGFERRQPITKANPAALSHISPRLEYAAAAAPKRFLGCSYSCKPKLYVNAQAQARTSCSAASTPSTTRKGTPHASPPTRHRAHPTPVQHDTEAASEPPCNREDGPPLWTPPRRCVCGPMRSSCAPPHHPEYSKTSVARRTSRFVTAGAARPYGCGPRPAPPLRSLNSAQPAAQTRCHVRCTASCSASAVSARPQTRSKSLSDAQDHACHHTLRCVRVSDTPPPLSSPRSRYFAASLQLSAHSARSPPHPAPLRKSTKAARILAPLLPAADSIGALLAAQRKSAAGPIPERAPACTSAPPSPPLCMRPARGTQQHPVSAEHPPPTRRLRSPKQLNAPLPAPLPRPFKSLRPIRASLGPAPRALRPVPCARPQIADALPACLESEFGPGASWTHAWSPAKHAQRVGRIRIAGPVPPACPLTPHPCPRAASDTLPEHSELQFGFGESRKHAPSPAKRVQRVGLGSRAGYRERASGTTWLCFAGSGPRGRIVSDAKGGRAGWMRRYGLGKRTRSCGSPVAARACDEIARGAKGGAARRPGIGMGRKWGALAAGGGCGETGASGVSGGWGQQAGRRTTNALAWGRRRRSTSEERSMQTLSRDIHICSCMRGDRANRRAGTEVGRADDGLRLVRSGPRARIVRGEAAWKIAG
ncbi:hypothetical protein B0H15DRAFT_958571 [Mycena belliarum]|uniref:Uncharacterized protein n=1 Tax=Mycena belliarum TaxID=1033014 RepID=A0AAD6XFJ8_9AGAR|nr:hypothetical protein B0H15DRAFT_958571 [Mycena belliae]